MHGFYGLSSCPYLHHITFALLINAFYPWLLSTGLDPSNQLSKFDPEKAPKFIPPDSPGSTSSRGSRASKSSNKRHSTSGGSAKSNSPALIRHQQSPPPSAASPTSSLESGDLPQQLSPRSEMRARLEGLTPITERESMNRPVSDPFQGQINGTTYSIEDLSNNNPYKATSNIYVDPDKAFSNEDSSKTPVIECSTKTPSPVKSKAPLPPGAVSPPVGNSPRDRRFSAESSSGSLHSHSSSSGV